MNWSEMTYNGQAWMALKKAGGEGRGGGLGEGSQRAVPKQGDAGY